VEVKKMLEIYFKVEKFDIDGIDGIFTVIEGQNIFCLNERLTTDKESIVIRELMKIAGEYECNNISEKVQRGS